MAEVTAIRSFEHNGTRPRGSIFTVSDRAAADLSTKGLVVVNYKPKAKAADPTAAAGQKSSALPVAPASPQKTARRSKRGEDEQTSGE